MFRFTIRDVLWLVVVGLAIGWWNAERHTAEVKAEFKSLNTDAHNAMVKFRDEIAEKGLSMESDGEMVSIKAAPKTSP
jgi:hypothetical protein